MREEKIWLEAGIGTLYHTTSLFAWKGDNKAKTEVQKYIDRIGEVRKEGLGLMAYGKNGVGKTLAMVEVLKAAGRETNPDTRMPYKIYMTSLSKIVTMFTSGWTSLESRKLFTNKILHSDFLLIDDAEKVYMPKDENNVVISATDSVLRERVNHKRPVLITSNETPAELTRVFGPSIGSLLKGWVIPIMFEGDDYRRTNNAEERWKKIRS